MGKLEKITESGGVGVYRNVDGKRKFWIEKDGIWFRFGSTAEMEAFRDDLGWIIATIREKSRERLCERLDMVRERREEADDG